MISLQLQCTAQTCPLSFLPATIPSHWHMQTHQTHTGTHTHKCTHTHTHTHTHTKSTLPWRSSCFFWILWGSGPNVTKQAMSSLQPSNSVLAATKLRRLHFCAEPISPFTYVLREWCNYLVLCLDICLSLFIHLCICWIIDVFSISFIYLHVHLCIG
jgi:hypothetical protein